MRKSIFPMSAGVALAFAAAAGAVVVAQDNPDATSNKAPAPEPNIAPAPSIEDRWAALQVSDAPGQATVVFDKRLADNQVEQLLSRAGVAPFAVHMFLEGMTGTHEVAVEKANLSIVGNARAKTASMQDAAVKGARTKASDILDRRSKQVKELADDERAKAILTGLEQSQRMAAAARRGAPTIYGVRVTGTAAQLKALAGQPLVSEVVPGYEVRGRMILPPPTPPADAKGAFKVPEIDATSGEQLSARLQSAANGK